MTVSYTRLAPPPSADSGTRSRHAAIEVHAVDTNSRIILDSKIDVLADTEPEVARLREVLGS